VDTLVSLAGAIGSLLPVALLTTIAFQLHAINKKLDDRPRRRRRE
jgi:hypothetical protein